MKNQFDSAVFPCPGASNICRHIVNPICLYMSLDIMVTVLKYICIITVTDPVLLIAHITKIIQAYNNVSQYKSNKLELNGTCERYAYIYAIIVPGGVMGNFSCLYRFQRKPLVSDPGMHHVPWCMSGSLTRCGGENVPGIPGACATRNFAYMVRGLYKYSCLIVNSY